VRQPEVAPLTRLLLAVVLAVPVLHGAERLGIATAFLIEFADARRGTLSALTAPPVEAPRVVPEGAADRFVPRTLRAPTPLVLVPGATPAGKDDPRARRAARLLARMGFDVTLPTIPGLTRGRLRPDDARPVVHALEAAARPSVVVAVSVGSGPALLAAADPRVRDRVALVLSLGGYASASELVRFYLTGAYGYGSATGHRQHDPDLVRAFVDANDDLLADPAQLAALLDALSPVRIAREITADVVLVHDRDDPVVPYTESVRLADARPGTTLVLINGLGHVGAAAGGPDWRALARLWRVAYRLAAAA
jgi:predicted alpha/beta hydrolase family esterase